MRVDIPKYIYIYIYMFIYLCFYIEAAPLGILQMKTLGYMFRQS